MPPPAETAASPGIEEDLWLSERFGHPVFTVSSPAGLNELPRAEPAMFQAKVPAERVRGVRELTLAGFAVVNVNLVLAAEPGAIAQAPTAIEVREADPGRDGAVAAIAERGFHASRFHLDPAVPDEVANRIKADWAANCLAGGRGEGMLVAEVDGAVAGFLAVVSGQARGASVRTIDLIAVDPDHRGRGVGAALVRRFATDSADGFDEVRVGTQAANPGATRFYERLGLGLREAAYDLHMHVGAGR